VPKCPTCNRTVAAADARWRPFCSERCRLIDLGEWISGRHRIPTDEAAPADEPGPPFTRH
jgi:endogenous inhibitor of DNA gyrase (YacG/DUF329 family)